MPNKHKPEVENHRHGWIVYEVFNQKNKRYIETISRELDKEFIEKSYIRVDEIIPVIRGWLDRDNYRTLIDCRVVTLEKLAKHRFKIYVEPLAQQARANIRRDETEFRLDSEGYDGWLRPPLP